MSWVAGINQVFIVGMDFYSLTVVTNDMSVLMLIISAINARLCAVIAAGVVITAIAVLAALSRVRTRSKMFFHVNPLSPFTPPPCLSRPALTASLCPVPQGSPCGLTQGPDAMSHSKRVIISRVMRAQACEQRFNDTLKVREIPVFYKANKL